MAAPTQTGPATAGRRAPLNRDRVLRAAVALADGSGIDAISMRKLAQHLGVVPMALYKHVANKEELLDGMVEAVIGEIEPPAAGAGWRDAVRQRVLSARQVLLRHPWASRVIETRVNRTPAVLGYMDEMTGLFLDGGFSPDLTHHVMHALGNRMWGFTRELFDDPGAEPAPPPPPEVMAALGARYPHIMTIAMEATGGRVPEGRGCNEQFEFEFALDILLDGFARLHERGWAPPAHPPTRPPAPE
ncbi:MAG TPA: TetR/AcrR family transcriptional regulator C-terminal domain-containing protein [Streptosporangiaceae bacterium]|jgi:AcrR family transcriptional regulator|nr:TetR/AcrR family transcriptional regulator C-terminal domain-containing protein [Streptosporangiaceae bacterium]